MHWHGYSYVGSGEAVGSFDRNNRSPDGANFRASNVPPFFVSHWLMRPSSSIARTANGTAANFDEPAAAVDWIAGAFEAAHTNPERQPWPPVADRRADSLGQLQSGNNVLYSAWTTTTTLAEYYLVSCPPPGGSAKCPLGRTDKRPTEGATVMNGMP